MDFKENWNALRRATPENYKEIALDVCVNNHGPMLPPQAFSDIQSLRLWYRTVRMQWMHDCFVLHEYWDDKLKADDHKLALCQLLIESHRCGIRRIQRRISREFDGTPQQIPIDCYDELESWCELLFEVLDHDEEFVSEERQILTFRYDIGVKERNARERKKRESELDPCIADMVSAMMEAISKGKPHRVEPDDEWILVVWSNLCDSSKNVEEIQTTLYIDAEEIPKRPNISILQDMIASTWRAMRRLGPVVHPEPEVASLSDVRRALDDVVMHCAAERDGNVVDVIEELDCVLWADAAREQDTQEFKNTRHDDLLRVICDIVDERLSGGPRVSNLQSRADAGCDVLIELNYPALKCGVQLKSWRDIKAEGFARNTLAQIQESRRHGLRRLYVVLCADLTDRSQKDKVGRGAAFPTHGRSRPAPIYRQIPSRRSGAHPLWLLDGR